MTSKKRVILNIFINIISLTPIFTGFLQKHASMAKFINSKGFLKNNRHKTKTGILKKC